MKSRSVLERIASFQPRDRDVLERRLHLWEGFPRGERLGQPGRFVLRCSKLPHRVGHDRAIAPGATGLKRRLDLVVAVQLLVGLILAEDTRELTPNAAVPVDQRAVTVERRPAVSRHSANLIF